MKSEAKRFFASQAWVQGEWASNVLLEVDATGHWSSASPMNLARSREKVKKIQPKPRWRSAS